METVGKVKIDTTCYPGVDLYSDGIVEDRILRLVQENLVSDFNKVIAREKDWAVLYHLSHVRANIIEWLPISKADSVLEIGAGCGAITGMLSQMAKEVDCIDLSKKRSLINATRNEDADNLTIHLGNFQEVAKHIEKKYDWITLIGVFEYGRSYIESKDPYVDFLKIVKGMLSEKGKLVIAIENKLGLKYFAGCAEDHSGVFFDGIEGYRGGGHAETFSKKELVEMLTKSGFAGEQFFYPYPDYKLPLSIYSDDYLPKLGELRNNHNNFDRRRFRVFDEEKAFDSIIEAGLFGELANSFLIVVSNDESKIEEKAFSKYANERASQFTVRTDILKNADGKFRVEKSPLCEAAKKHVQNICDKQAALQEQYHMSRFIFNKCQSEDDSVELEFLTGETLEEVADRLLLAGKIDEVKALIEKVIVEIFKVNKNITFEKTEEFVKVFGDVKLSEDWECAKISDVDMILSNIIDGEKWEVIDYEWSFDFPVPLAFIAYRLVHYYLATNPTRSILREDKMMKEIGLDKTDVATFASMEEHFQNVYVLGEQDGSHHTPLRDMYADISDGEMDIRVMDMQLAATRAELGNQRNANAKLTSDLQEKVSENAVLDDKLKQREALITDMENTKVWKTYRTIKGLGKSGKE